MFAALELDPSSEFYVLRTSAEPDKFVQWAFEGIGAVIGRSLVGEKLAFFCSNAQVCCHRRHMFWPTSKRFNNTKGDVHADESFKYDNCAADSSDDEEEEEDENFDPFATADAVATVDDSYAAQLERYIFAITDAYAARGRRLEPARVEEIVEALIMTYNRKEGGSLSFLNFWVNLIPDLDDGEGLFANVDACDLAACGDPQRKMLRASLELLQVPRDHRDGQTVDAERLTMGLGFEGLLNDAEVHVRTDGLASWDEITIFGNRSQAKTFYLAAQDAGYDVSRAWVIELDERLRRVEGLDPSRTFAVLTHSLPLAQCGALLGDASVLRRAADAADIGRGGNSISFMGPLLKGDRNNNPALDAVLARLEKEGFHTGPVAAYNDVLDPETTALRKKLRDTCGITDAKAEAVIDAVKNVDGLIFKTTFRLLVAALQAGATLAPERRDALRRAAEETKCESETGFGTSKTLKPLLDLLNYADSDDAVLEKKAALVKAFDEGNVHKQNGALITYDVFIAKDAEDYVKDFAAAAQAAGFSSVTLQKAEALVTEIGKHRSEGLNGCQAKDLIEVLTALLRAGPCDGRALESVDRLAQACIAAGLRKGISGALMHLLNPLNREDGNEPTRKKDKDRWNERRAAARRVADLLHDMGIHKNNFRFASYDAVQKKWKAKYDASEPEPEAKRPKRS